VPLTPFQHGVLATVSSGEAHGYLAGGAAIHFAPNTARYSDDLDFFHDTEARVAAAFAADRKALEAAGYALTLSISQPGHIRAVVSRGDDATRVDWAHDSAWRFLPLVHTAEGIRVLHPIDLAVNKVLALAGRDEPRDFVDILVLHRDVLPLGALVWAAVGKDPGFTPLSLLELLKRRGRYRPEDFERLSLAAPFDLVSAKQTWLSALDKAESFAHYAPPDDAGCLYWSASAESFTMPTAEEISGGEVFAHFGRPGGVVARPLDD
jgi:hypothetical protein